MKDNKCSIWKSFLKIRGIKGHPTFCYEPFTCNLRWATHVGLVTISGSVAGMRAVPECPTGWEKGDGADVQKPGIVRVRPGNVMSLFSARKLTSKVTDPEASCTPFSIPSSCPPFFPPSSTYLCCSSRATQNLTQYILPRKWNKEVCLQLGLDGDHLLDVFQELPPLSLWRHCHCFCFSYVLTDTETGSVLTVWQITQASFNTNAENMYCVEKQKPWPLAEWHSLVLPSTEVLGK